MIYSNFEFFLLYFPTLILFVLFSRPVHRFYTLLVASLIFYSWAGLFDSLIFFGVILVSWSATWLANKYPAQKKYFLATGILVMAFHLFFWKYFPWVSTEIQRVFPKFLGGVAYSLPLPVGISFFTLQGIAYLVDYAKNDAHFIRFKDYMLFKSFFPQLVAGPIVRVPQLLPQIQRPGRTSIDDIAAGLSLFVMGWVKKVVIADRCAKYVDAVFQYPQDYGRQTLILAAIGYTFQIWGDFSGYTDMGRGVARTFGIRLPENFLSPYLAKSPSEFWKRWHITLSEWIRDYIYIPLGGNRGSAIKASLVLLFTMSVSGLWHGANWNFIIWGLFHTGLLIIERLGSGVKLPKVPGLLRWATLQIAIAIGWIVFRAENLEQLRMFFSNLAHPPAEPSFLGGTNIYSSVFLGFMIQAVTYYNFQTRSFTILEKMYSFFSLRQKALRYVGILCGLALAFVFVGGLFFRTADTSKDFIYFRF